MRRQRWGVSAFSPGEGRAFDRDEEVDRHRIGLERAQRVAHVEHVRVALTHPEEGSGAGREAARPRLRHRRFTVGEGVRLADLAVEVLTRVEVVVVSEDAGFTEPLRLPVVEQPEAGADLQRCVPALDRLDATRYVLEFALRGPASTRHEAEARRSQFARPRGRRAEGLFSDQRVRRNGCRRIARLRAVVAVLRTEPALDVQEQVQLHPPAEGGDTHAAHGVDDLEGAVVVGCQEPGEALAPGIAPVQASPHERIESFAEVVRHGFAAYPAPAPRGSRGTIP